jgi:hypothetical protein
VAVVQYTFTHKQYTQQHNSLIKKSADRASFLKLYPDICLTSEKKARKNISQDSRRMPVGKEYTEQSILLMMIYCVLLLISSGIADIFIHQCLDMQLFSKFLGI